MRLRPRYSLLTLLILTALVAGGVKYWRGPHRAVMSNPSTVEESLLREWPKTADGRRYAFEPVAYEYDYLNEWNKRRYLFIKGYSTDKRPIPVGEFTNVPGLVCLYPRNILANAEELAVEAKLAKQERVVCWLYSASIVAQEDGLRKEIYFLTSRKKIYLHVRLPSDSVLLWPAELSDIADVELRERIVEELDQIPEPAVSDSPSK